VVPVRWDPAQYQRYAGERGRPFADLLAQVGADAPSYVVDLGCGPGTLTVTLADRWPTAFVQGVDHSAEMLAEAQEHTQPGRLEFTRADLRDWRPTTPVDVLVSNATLQWVPGHLELLTSWVGWLSADGWLAIQLPGNHDAPAHVALRELASEDPYARYAAEAAARPALPTLLDYQQALVTSGCRVNAWETTYLHVLTGPDPVLQWMRGTGARPVLQALPDELREDFEREYAARLRAAFPAQPYGTVLPFRRLFVVARRVPDRPGRDRQARGVDRSDP
jgi:trans-aconitate 2-methyltransferase